MRGDREDDPARRFTRPEHRAVIRALQAANAHLLADCRCYFGGGTAIVLDIGEYRLSRDIDFLCADEDGYRTLRNAVALRGAGALFGAGVVQHREFKRDQYGIRGTIEHSGVPILFEIVREARITLDGAPHPSVPVMSLDPTDRVAEKLLANADRCRDRSSAYRDAIDLGMLAWKRGGFPSDGVAKATKAYGDEVKRCMLWARHALSKPGERTHAALTLGMAPDQVDAAAEAFRREVSRIWPSLARQRGGIEP